MQVYFVAKVIAYVFYSCKIVFQCNAQICVTLNIAHVFLCNFDDNFSMYNTITMANKE
jgi:hypothetical protein